MYVCVIFIYILISKNKLSGYSGGYLDHIEYGTSSRKKSKGSSIMTALTLLSFFFFLSTLQNCLKDHLQAMNPTVMVMTAGNARSKSIMTTVDRESLDELDDIDLNENYNNDTINENFYPNLTHKLPKIVKINSKIELNNENFYKNNENSHLIRIN